ncbi:MAG: hypothetical protein VW907_09730, partial [Opitutae bacterium]
VCRNRPPGIDIYESSSVLCHELVTQVSQRYQIKCDNLVSVSNSIDHTDPSNFEHSRPNYVG